MVVYPKFTPPLVEKMKVELCLQDWEQADDTCNRILQVDPGSVEAARFKTLQLMCRRGHAEEAASQLRRLTQELERAEPKNAGQFRANAQVIKIKYLKVETGVNSNFLKKANGIFLIYIYIFEEMTCAICVCLKTQHSETHILLTKYENMISHFKNVFSSCFPAFVAAPLACWRRRLRWLRGRPRWTPPAQPAWRRWAGSLYSGGRSRRRTGEMKAGREEALNGK